MRKEYVCELLYQLNKSQDINLSKDDPQLAINRRNYLNVTDHDFNDHKMLNSQDSKKLTEYLDIGKYGDVFACGKIGIYPGNIQGESYLLCGISDGPTYVAKPEEFLQGKKRAIDIPHGENSDILGILRQSGKIENVKNPNFLPGFYVLTQNGMTLVCAESDKEEMQLAHGNLQTDYQLNNIVYDTKLYTKFVQLDQSTAPIQKEAINLNRQGVVLEDIDFYVDQSRKIVTDLDYFDRLKELSMESFNKYNKLRTIAMRNIDRYLGLGNRTRPIQPEMPFEYKRNGD